MIDDALDALSSCQCCLLGGQQRSLKTLYFHLGKTEIYSDMLKECFDIRLSVGSEKSGICEVCVGRLRDASNFKQQVQRSQLELRKRLKRALQILEEEPAATVKGETDEGKTSYNLLDEEPTVELSDDDGASPVTVMCEGHDVTSDETVEDGTKDYSPEEPAAVVKPEIDEDERDATNDNLSDENHSIKSEKPDDAATSDEDLSPTMPLSARAREQLGMTCFVRLERLTKKVQSEAEQGLSQDKVSLSEEGLRKGKRVRQRDFCVYCETYILNFARHMIRNHPEEPEVQKALAASKNSASRKKVFRDLQKKGNYLSNVQSSFKPMKNSRYSDKTDYLPCTKCLGFYSKKQLWKHLKKCDHNLPRNKAQVDAQNFLLRNVQVDNSLMNEVFPMMNPDKISYIAKKDSLICMFGAQYLRSHRGKHFATVVSRKMRELAKLFVEVSTLKTHIVSLEQALRPQYYDTLVQATKIVARYDDTKRQCDAPTYAMNIATSIKQCCSIALLHSCKTEATVDTAGVQSDLKTLSSLIGDNWRFDTSGRAADDLNVKKRIENEVVDCKLTDGDPISRPKGISNSRLHHSSIAEQVRLKDTTNKNPTKKKRTFTPWTTEQKNVVTKYFEDHIKSKRPPKRAECDALKDKYSELLENKDWLKIKVYVQNSYTKK